MPTIAAVVPLVWLSWLVLTDWVPMFPLNDLSRQNFRHRLIAGVISCPFPLLVSAGIALHRDWSLAVSAVLCALILTGHVLSWWVPYSGHSTEAQRELYRREFTRTLKVVPAEGHDVVIDLQHTVVGALTLVMCASTLAVMLVR